MRLVPGLIAAMLLSGCNVVLSKEPWFSRDDEQAGQVLAPGLWAEDRSADCRYDQRRPLETWPECAQAFVVRPHEILFPEQGEWDRYEVLLAAGEPAVLQVSDCLGGKNAPAGQAQADKSRVFCYIAIEPKKISPAGAIVAFTSWPVACGPPGRRDSYVTDRPFAGLTVEDKNCTARSQEALRRAARLSEAVAGSKGGGKHRSHWVREGYR